MIMNDTAVKKNDQTRTMEIGTSVVFGLILAVFAVGFIPLSHPVLTRLVTKFVRQTGIDAGIDSCTIGSLGIAFWKGMTLHNVRSSGAIDTAGRRFTVEAQTITLSGNFLHTVINYKKSINGYSASQRSTGTLPARSEACAAVPLFSSEGSLFPERSSLCVQQTGSWRADMIVRQR